VYLVRRGHFRLRDKDGDHITRSTIAENPILHANVTVLSYIETELLSIKVFFTLGIGIFAFFAPVTLTLTR